MTADGRTGRRLRLIVVDDNEDVAKSLSMLLRFAGHDVDAYLNGGDAMRALQTVRPDAILLDIAMPGLDGLKVATWIRDQAHLADMPILAISGCCQPYERDNAKAAGFTHFFIKPVSFQSLRELLVTL